MFKKLKKHPEKINPFYMLYEESKFLISELNGIIGRLHSINVSYKKDSGLFKSIEDIKKQINDLKFVIFANEYDKFMNELFFFYNNKYKINYEDFCKLKEDSGLDYREFEEKLMDFKIQKKKNIIEFFEK